jgi:TRAP-type mannitol/chloroaromatic compound transport system substrate-binding protein
MLSELAEVVTKLFEFSDRLKQAEDEKRQRIESYLLKIEDCLRSSAEQLKNGEAPHSRWAELRVYAEELPKTIIDEVGEEKAKELSLLLEKTAINMPTDNSYVQSIETAAGRFRGLVVTIATKTEEKRLNGKKQPSPILPIPRKTFLYTSIGALSALGGIGANRLADKLTRSIEWKMVSFLGENAKNFILYKAPQMVCDLIKEMTDNHFRIEVDRSGETGTEKILEDVSRGLIQCGFSGIYYNNEKYRPLFFGCAIPFGLNPQEQNAWLFYKKNPEDELTFMQGIYKELDLNVISFPTATTGGQMGGWFKQEVFKAEDFKKIMMRIPGLGANVLQELGAKTDEDIFGRAISIDRITIELENGNINAAEWIGPHDDLKLGLHKVTKYYYYPGWWEPSTTFDIHINQNEWERLPKEYRSIFKAACFETYKRIQAEYEQKNSYALQEIKKLEALREIKMQHFSDGTPGSILEESRNQTKALLELYSKDTTFDKVYTEWRSFKKQIRAWSNLNIYKGIED